MKHEAVPVSCTPIPRNLLKEHWLLPRGNVKDADGIRKSGVLVVPPDNPHMGRIQPAKSEWVPPTGRFHYGFRGLQSKNELTGFNLGKVMELGDSDYRQIEQLIA